MYFNPPNARSSRAGTRHKPAAGPASREAAGWRRRGPLAGRRLARRASAPRRSPAREAGQPRGAVPAILLCTARVLMNAHSATLTPLTSCIKVTIQSAGTNWEKRNLEVVMTSITTLACRKGGNKAASPQRHSCPFKHLLLLGGSLWRASKRVSWGRCQSRTARQVILTADQTRISGPDHGQPLPEPKEQRCKQTAPTGATH